ncbi:hypothetical protein GW17_00053415 [Ensete ventricosum]|nr:hypothetical protein GW17_00053415 [Ensete ventricosum]
MHIHLRYDLKFRSLSPARERLRATTSNHIRTVSFPVADLDSGDRDIWLRTLFRSPHERRWVTGGVCVWDPTPVALTGWTSLGGPGLSISTHHTILWLSPSCDR